MRAAPAVSCARLCEECAHEHTVQRRQSDIPCAMALRLMPCSPRRRIRLVTVAAGLMASPIRSDRISHRQLDTSNGAGTTRFCVRFSVVRLVRPDRSRKPPCDHTCAPDAAASTASIPTFVTTPTPS